MRVDGWLLHVARPLRRGHDHAGAAVCDQAHVEEVQRLHDVARVEVVVLRQRVAHHGDRVEAGVRALGDGDRRHLLLGGAVLVHVAAERHRGRAGDVEEAVSQGVVRCRGAREEVAVGALVRPVDAGHGAGEPAHDQHRREVQREVARAVVEGGAVAGIEPQHRRDLRIHAQVAEGAAGQQTVDVVLFQTGVVEGELEGVDGDLVAVLARDRALPGGADAGDRHPIAKLAQLGHAHVRSSCAALAGARDCMPKPPTPAQHSHGARH